MTYNLHIGDNVIIRNRGPEGENWDVLNSFWFGYRFNVVGDNVLTIEDGFMAVYCSHASDKPIQSAVASDSPLLAEEFGDLKSTVEIVGVSQGEVEPNKLTMQGLQYLATEDVECGNQAMQFHLLRFQRKAPGPKGWFDDKGWTSVYDPPTVSLDAMPMWVRRIKYDDADPRYCHAVWRRRNAATTLSMERKYGLRFLGVSMPLGRNSLFSHLLSLHDDVMPEITVEAFDENEVQHWQEIVNVKNFTGPQRPHGVVMICHGAFSELGMSDALDETWFRLIENAQQEELSRRLLAVISKGSERPHSLRQLGDLHNNCIVPAPHDHPHVFFGMWI